VTLVLLELFLNHALVKEVAIQKEYVIHYLSYQKINNLTSKQLKKKSQSKLNKLWKKTMKLIKKESFHLILGLDGIVPQKFVY